ncbi:MAG: hypothetical protein DSZ28_03555 [Thiothrix sp.]|nr:MAG: hypothetical protein DSZ28_03555 [Thiothrix sp.]
MKGSGSSKSQRFRQVASATIFIAATLLIFSSLAGAAIINVTIEADVTDPSDELLSLREAFFAAGFIAGNDTIVLASGGNYQLTDCTAGELKITDDANLIVEGNGATITQTCTDKRILHKTSLHFELTLQHMSLIGGLNSGVRIDGAAINAKAVKLMLIDVSITNVSAGPGGSVLQILPGVFLDMDRVTMTGNTGTAIRGGSVGVKISNSTISNNTGSGMFFSDGNPIIIEDSTISNNGGTGVGTTGQFGSGNFHPDVTITGSIISNNSQGGVSCTPSCREITITNSQIIDNGIGSGVGLGGGIVVSLPLYDPPAPSDLSTKLIIHGSTISGNKADHSGGGVHVDSGLSLTSEVAPTVITNSIFENNQVTCAGCDGGAISVGFGEVSISDSTFNGNTAEGDGGGISQKDNGNGIGIIGQSIFSLSGTSVTNNQSGGYGGGLAIYAAEANISSSLIQGNTAKSSGGGLLAGGNFSYLSGNTSIIGSTISGNTAAYGGGVSVGGPDGSLVKIENSTVDGNTATVAGGGFAVGTTEQLGIDNGTVIENSAPTGANIAASGSTTLTRSIIAQPIGGGTNCSILTGSPVWVSPPIIINNGFSWFNDSTCEAGSNDIVDLGGDPQLGPLADNGGPTLTRLPAITSPVVGLVPVTDCPLSGDQRETPRPSGIACEAGAVEISEGMTYQLPNNQWQQISLPSDPGNDNKVDYIFGDDGLGTLGTDWAMFYYDANNGGYIEIKKGDELYQGVGYWIIQTTGDPQTLEMPLASQPTPVTNPVGCIESASGCFEIPLEKLQPNATQWHMVGYPFTTARDLSDSRVLTGKGNCAEGCVLDTAENEGIVHNQVWTYNGKRYNLIKGGDQLEPWRAYWSATLPDASDSAPVKLLIPKP